MKGGASCAAIDLPEESLPMSEVMVHNWRTLLNMHDWAAAFENVFHLLSTPKRCNAFLHRN